MSAAAGRRLYGRRRSHRLRKGQARALSTRGDARGVPLPDGAGPASLDPLALFGGAVDAAHLEIGFGGGEHLARLAAIHPRVGFIGCEHYVDGVAKFLARAAREELSNVRVHAHDARDVMDALRPASIARIYLLYPDPWP